MLDTKPLRRMVTVGLATAIKNRLEKRLCHNNGLHQRALVVVHDQSSKTTASAYQTIAGCDVTAAYSKDLRAVGVGEGARSRERTRRSE